MLVESCRVFRVHEVEDSGLFTTSEKYVQELATTNGGGDVSVSDGIGEVYELNGSHRVFLKGLLLYVIGWLCVGIFWDIYGRGEAIDARVAISPLLIFMALVSVMAAVWPRVRNSSLCSNSVALSPV